MQEQGMAYCAYSKYGLTWRQFNKLGKNSPKQQAFMLTKSGGCGTTGLYKTLKVAGKAGFALTMVTSGLYAYDAYKNDRPDRNRRYIKAGADFIVGVGCLYGGPIGWAVGGAYYLADVCGFWNYCLDIKED